MDFLRFALPDEIATTLSRMRPLAIRPSAATSQYSGDTVDLQAVGREIGANRIVTGRYLLAGGQLQITVEAADVDDNRLLWRDTVNVPAGNLLVLQAQISAMARGKLAAALGASEFVRPGATPAKERGSLRPVLDLVRYVIRPRTQQGGVGNAGACCEARRRLRSAWFALSSRSYADARFGGGGDAMLARSDAASEQALALDADYVDAAAELILHRVERGDSTRALQQAGILLRRWPDNAQAHHLLSYALRYAGSVEEAGRHCETAVLLDPQVTWGSCSSTFMELRNYTRAKDFLRKDLSSEWSKAHAVEILVREGKTREAIQIGPPAVPHWDSYKMLLACAAGRPQSEIDALARVVEVSDDPEVNYFFAAHLAYCGQTSASLRFLQLAIDGNHCSYPAVDMDPLFDGIRASPEFARTRASAVACHDRFSAAAKSCCGN